MGENDPQSSPEHAETPLFNIKDYASYEDSVSGSSADPTAVTGEEGTTRRKSCSSSEAIGNHADLNAAVTASQEANGQDVNIAEEKTETRGREPPGAKRGGRQYNGWAVPFSWRRWNGGPYEIGDPVEAEWMGTGWWYAGYVVGKDERSGAQECLYHVVFADGDEADMRGKYLKRLRPPGHTRGTLPPHVPIVDLGSRVGRLHRDAPHSTQHRQGYNRPPLGNSDDKEQGGTDEATDDHARGKKPEPASAPEDALSLKQRSSKTIHDSQRGEHTELRDHATRTGSWWSTGTQYALQPHIADFRRDRISESGTSSLAVSHDINGNKTRNRQQLLRVLQPAEGNEAQGKRIFFLA